MQVKEAALLTGIKYPRATAIYRAFKSQFQQNMSSAMEQEDIKASDKSTNEERPKNTIGTLFWRLFDESAHIKQ